MKAWVFFSAVCAALVSVPASAAINSASQDVLRMVQNGVSEPVLEGYVNRSSSAYNLSADDILYLQQNGVPQPVISAMLAHDSTVAQGQTPQYTQPQNFTQNPQYAQPQPQSDTQTYEYNQSPPPDQTGQVNPPDVAAYGSYGDQVYSDQSAPVMQVAPDQAPPQVASFYDPLRPYGTWIYLEGYGWCWQPSVVRTQPTWQPYCDNGQWLYCDDGWYWQSGYPWGWAPFHYGRWMNASCGWVWFPDTVWAPSWVCWRDSGDYCGWAPLPPSGFVGYGRPGFHFGVNVGVGLGAGLFTFIHFGDIFHGSYHHHEIPRSQVTQIYNRSRVINNVRMVNNNYARNPGISRRTVQRYTGPVQVAHVRTSTEDPRTHRPGVVRNGSQVAVVRPERPPAPERNTHIVGHRLPANARSVPTTPVNNINERRGNNRPQNVNSARTTSGVQRNQPRTSATQQPNQRLQTPRTSETSRTYNPRTTERQHTPNPTATQTPRTRPNNPSVSEIPHPGQRPNELRQPNQPARITETPRPSNPRTGEVPRTNPRVTGVPHPNANPRVSETPHPSQTPRVSEVPHPAPHVTQTPEVHRAFPTESPRVEPRAPVHEPAGARAPAAEERVAPTRTPHVAAPPAHEAAPHISAPRHEAAPHPAPQAHEVHAPGPSAHATAAPHGHDDKDHGH